MSSIQVAHQLNEQAQGAEDTTSDATVRTMLQRAQIPPRDRRKVLIPFYLEEWERDQMQRHADAHGITFAEIHYRVVRECAVLDDLYDAVTDGRYS